MKQVLIACYLFALACQPTKPAPRAGEDPMRVVDVTPSLAAAPLPEAETADQPVALPAGTFAFSDDLSGRILGRVLPPNEPARLAADARATPRPRRELPGLERPEVPT